MIPKKIHYIWLSDEPLNKVAKRCIESWREYASEYEIVRWSMNDFDFSEMPKFVNEAIECEKWAFACDYLRLYVLYNEGGLYLDSDVLMVKNIDDLINHRFVSSVEYYPGPFEENCANVDADGHSSDDFVIGLNIQAAVMASEPGHPFIRSCMDYYEGKSFVNQDGTLNNDVVAPQIYANIARAYGFKYVNKEQVLDNDIMLYSSEMFAPGYRESNEASVAVHLCNGSWRDMTKKEKIRNEMIKGRQIKALL